jgi:hypothetical protein
VNSVEQIYDSLVSISGTALGGSWQRLKKVFQPEQNDFRNIEQAYAIRHSSATPDTDATKVFVLSHKFDIILANRSSNRDTDLTIQETLNQLYTQVETIFEEAVRTKLNLIFVTHVDGLEYLDPQILENGAVLLTASLDVRYYIDPY